MTIEKAARVFLNKSYKNCSAEEIKWLEEKIKDEEKECRSHSKA